MEDYELKLLGNLSFSFFTNKNVINILSETFPLANYFRSVGDDEGSSYQSTSPAGKPKLLSVLLSLRKREKVEVWGNLLLLPREGG